MGTLHDDRQVKAGGPYQGLDHVLVAWKKPLSWKLDFRLTIHSTFSTPKGHFWNYAIARRF